MTQDDYKIVRDKFEFDISLPWVYLCRACKHRRLSGYDEPCRTCDYNAIAVPDEKGKAP